MICFGAILVPPTHPNADLGVLFLDNGGCVNMCGHATIGVTTVAVQSGIVKPGQDGSILLDTPAGIVKARAHVSKDGMVQAVSFVNVPSFCFARDIKVFVPQIGNVTVDITFGGNFFVFVNSETVGVNLTPENVPEIKEIGLRIRSAVNQTIRVFHPELPLINSVAAVEFYDAPISCDDGTVHSRNTVVFGRGQLDRSPCGTGTCARMALLHAQGKLKVGQEFVHESILGTKFRGKILKETHVGRYPAVGIEITGSAYITGYSCLRIGKEDPFRFGFSL